MTVQKLIAELRQRGITLVVRNSKILSKPAIPTDLLPALKEHKADIIRELEYRGHIAHIKKTFKATELAGPEVLRAEYNFVLAKLRGLEQYLDDKGIPLAKREGMIPEFKRLSQQLSDILNVIGEYSREQAIRGFEV